MKTHKRLRSHPAFATTAGLSALRSPPHLSVSRVSAARQIIVSSSVAPIPGSLVDACAQARVALAAAKVAGKRRLFLEIDTSAGDETYTLLKNSLPIVRDVAPSLLRNDSSRVWVLLPDSGAAALLVRDWNRTGMEIPPALRVVGLEEAEVDAGIDAGVVIVVPRASEVERMEQVVSSAGDLPVLIVNPDLVDMGVTGLSLNARQLRERLIDDFENAYYLKVFGWGVMLRAYPGKWGLWVDDSDTKVGFRLVCELDERPSSADIEEVLQDIDGVSTQGPFQSFVNNISRFLNVYTKG